MEGPVFIENNWISPVLNTRKKILGNIAGEYWGELPDLPK